MKLKVMLFLAGGYILTGVSFANTLNSASILPPLYFELSSGYSFPFNEKYVINVLNDPIPLYINQTGSVFFGAEAGYRFNSYLNAGVEVAYRPDFKLKGYDPNETPGFRNIDIVPVKALTVMINGQFNVGTYKKFTPYITAGLGTAINRLGDVNVHNQVTNEPVFYQPSGNKANFAWQAGAGVNYELSQNIGIDLRGRFIDLGKAISSTNTAGVVRPQGTAVSFSTALGDHDVLKFKAFEFGLGIVMKIG